MEHPVSKGYFCNLRIGRPIELEDVSAIKKRMQEIIAEDIPFRRTECHTTEAVRVFSERGMNDKVKLLETSGSLYTYYYTLGDTVDYYYGNLLPGTGFIKLFDIVKYYDGLLLRIPNKENPTVLEEVVKQAQNALGMYGRKTILFIDEIHRFNKGQQDYLLPFVEDGTIILIGATTENPYFEVNGALLSRSIVFELKALEIPEIKELLLRKNSSCNQFIPRTDKCKNKHRYNSRKHNWKNNLAKSLHTATSIYPGSFFQRIRNTFKKTSHCYHTKR